MKNKTKIKKNNTNYVHIYDQMQKVGKTFKNEKTSSTNGKQALR